MANIEIAMNTFTPSMQPNAAESGTFLIGGDLPVHRLGYGTMRLVGEGAWGEPAEPEE